MRQKKIIQKEVEIILCDICGKDAPPNFDDEGIIDLYSYEICRDCRAILEHKFVLMLQKAIKDKKV